MTTLLRRLLRAAPAPAPASLSGHLPFSTRSRRTPHRFRRSRRGPNPPPPSPDAVSAAIASLPSRLTPPVLASSLASTSDARLLLPLLTHSLRIPAFRPAPAPFLVAIKRLATADLYADFDRACALFFSLLPSLPSPGPLLRTALYFYCQFRRLGKAFHVYTLMRASADPSARPSADTYHALFTALLSRGGGDTMVHYMYMDTVSALFRQMLEEGIPPDTRALNVLVKGYAQSLHVNDALRVFHQMRPLYGCEADAFTYSYLVHGLSAQGRTRNARELFEEMRVKGLVPTEPACNAFVSALAMAGEVEEAERVMWEMARAGRVVDDITRRAVVEELWRAGKREDADRIVREMEERGILGARERQVLLGSIHDDSGDDNLDIDDRGRSTR
ncbi:pentatricopeptide repeat-containing protein At2g27800, mitochondrial-like [Phragmites australis]|uniref:pentatricopeptide repeat-containing protein At2g27800, mitochondrial-like n=1 Tax=Phragmites australis TaxID=29695 RepID=UPI002D783AAF|nr:pentatricopeptide repeat-containing protein At2g27800, mitochondrial-like [Phragmites australis]